MKRQLLTGMALVVLLGAAMAQESAATDKDKLQGTWDLVSGRTRGKEMSKEFLSNGHQLVIAGDRATFRMSRGKYEGAGFTVTYKLDATKNPRQIDVIHAGKGKAGNVVMGIYRFKGDTLTMVLAKSRLKGGPNGQPVLAETAERPTTFDAADATVYILKRHKDD
jgi:uncharacterized protein (TIGR03067 family)